MIEIVPYQASWPDEFASLALGLRETLGDCAIAIHHIGSTAVPNLDAKDVIDSQVTVASLDDSIRTDMLAAGYLPCRAGIDHCPPGMELPDSELTKMLFNGAGRRANIHIRVEGRFNQRYPLLCRDYLRAHPAAAVAYGEIKRQLARYFPDDIEAYYDIKDPVFDIIMTGAREWQDAFGWVPPATDA